MDKLRKTPEPLFYSFGVYAIECKTNHRVYVGMTAKSFIKRWRQHRISLHMRNHMRSEMQQDWNTYGDAAFIFSILEVMSSTDELKEREELHILTTARAIGARQMYNSFFAIRAGREEFGIVTKTFPRGMQQIFPD